MATASTWASVEAPRTGLGSLRVVINSRGTHHFKGTATCKPSVRSSLRQTDVTTESSACTIRERTTSSIWTSEKVQMAQRSSSGYSVTARINTGPLSPHIRLHLRNRTALAWTTRYGLLSPLKPTLVICSQALTAPQLVNKKSGTLATLQRDNVVCTLVHVVN